MSKIPYVRLEEQQTAPIRCIEIPYAQQLGLQQLILQLHRPTYMVWSNLCYCCCCPLGIAAICYSNKVSKKTANNDQVGALEASQKARSINIAATVIGSIGVIVTVVILIIYFVVFRKTVSYILDENFPFT